MPLYQFVITLAVVGLLFGARKPLHPHAAPDQGDPERRGGDCRNSVDRELVQELLCLVYIRSVRRRPRLITAVVTLVVVGLLLWVVNAYIPMQSQIKGILNGVVVIVVVLWLMKAFGVYGYLTQFRVGH